MNVFSVLPNVLKNGATCVGFEKEKKLKAVEVDLETALKSSGPVGTRLVVEGQYKNAFTQKKYFECVE